MEKDNPASNDQKSPTGLCPTCNRPLPATPVERLSREELEALLAAWKVCFNFVANENLERPVYVRPGELLRLAPFSQITKPLKETTADHHGAVVEVGRLLSWISSLTQLPGGYVLKKDDSKGYARYYLKQIQAGFGG